MTGQVRASGATNEAVEGAGVPWLATRDDRAAVVTSVRHSTELAGARSTETARVLQDLWVDGHIGLEELGRRTRALHGIANDEAEDECAVEELVQRFLPDALIDSAAATLDPGPRPTG